MKMNGTTAAESQAKAWTIEEIRAFSREHLEAMVREQVIGFITAVMGEEVAALCGPRFSRKGAGRAYRGGSEPGSVFIEGRRHAVQKPRVRKDGAEVPVTTYDRLHSYGQLGDFIFQAMLAGVSSRSYEGILGAHMKDMGVSKSQAAREHIKAARRALNELNTRRFPDTLFWAIVIDGIHVGGEVIIVALGVDLAGNKHFLGISEGSTENADVVRGLLATLAERDIRFTERVVAVTDGAKALHKGLRDHFGNRVFIQRCLNHKKRNVLGRLLKKYHREFLDRLTRAYGCNDHAEVQKEMEKLIAWLDSINHNAAESMKEGVEELLTLHRIEMPPPLRKSFYTSNLIDSAFAHPRSQLNRVKHWRKDSDMIKCWVGSRLLEQERQFRRVKNHGLIGAFLEKFISVKKVVDGKEAAA